MNIAIIDDDKDILELLKKYLEKSGDRVTTYQNPMTALSSLGKHTDVVLLDVIMPQINGLDLLPKLLEKYPDLKVIIMTSYSTLDRVLDSHRYGAVYYVMKPIESLAKLRKKIEEVTKK